MRVFVAVTIAAILMIALGHFAEAIGIVPFLAIIVGALGVIVLDSFIAAVRYRRYFWG